MCFLHSLLVLALVGTLGALSETEHAATPLARGRNDLVLRGEKQKVYFLPARGERKNRTVFFVPGDGGWRGFAVEIAERLAREGYDVYGLDTKRYLSSFTGKAHLTPKEVMADFHELSTRFSPSGIPVTLVGWSTGAGLCVLAGADENKQGYDGLVAISLGEVNILGWRWIDNVTSLFGKIPNEPTFKSSDYVPKIAPLPTFVIQSSSDQYIPNEEAHALFVQTRRPKHFRLIHARNHSFEGNRDGFFTALSHGLAWIGESRPTWRDHAENSRTRLEKVLGRSSFNLFHWCH